MDQWMVEPMDLLLVDMMVDKSVTTKVVLWVELLGHWTVMKTVGNLASGLVE